MPVRAVKGAAPAVDLTKPPAAGKEKGWVAAFLDDAKDALDTLEKWSTSDFTDDYKKKMAAKAATGAQLDKVKDPAATYGYGKLWDELKTRASQAGAAVAEAASKYAGAVWILVMLYAWSEASKRGW